MEISINSELREKWPYIVIGSIDCEIQVKPSDDELVKDLNTVAENFLKNMKVEEISSLPPIKEGRKAYKTLGKDPARYRLSSEALLRRIIKGKGLPPVNNIVDINNLVSLKSYLPICAFDRRKISPPVEFTIGQKEDEYYGIGRGKLNVENLPVFADKNGKFGSTTTDSERVKITPSTTSISMNIVSFNGDDVIKLYLQILENYLVRFADAIQINRNIISCS